MTTISAPITVRRVTITGPITFGRAGKSAYQIAVDNGYIGTEVEWLASLAGADPRGTLLGPVDLSNDGAWDAALIVIDDLPAGGALQIEFENLQSDGDIYMGVAGATAPPEVCLDPLLDNPALWHGATHPSSGQDNSVFPVDGLLSFSLIDNDPFGFQFQLAIPIDPLVLVGDTERVSWTALSGPDDLSYQYAYGLVNDDGFIWITFTSSIGGDVVLSDLSLKTAYLSVLDGGHTNPLNLPPGTPRNEGSLIIRDFNDPDRCPYWSATVLFSDGVGGAGGNAHNSGAWNKGRGTKVFVSSTAPITGGTMQVWHKEAL